MRATYAPQLHGLADYLVTPLPGFAPTDEAPDHWDRGARGLIARRLVDDLAEDAERPQRPRRRGRTLAARLRNRLR